MNEDYVGQVRAFDLTHGDNGWHPHFHAAIVMRPGVSAEVARAFLEERGDAYRTAVRAMGGKVSKYRVAWRVDHCSHTNGLAKYQAKIDGGWGVGLELARSDVKRARGGGDTIWTLMRAAAIDGDADAARLVVEFDRAMKGFRAIIIGRKLKELYGADVAGLDDDDGTLAGKERDRPVIYQVVIGSTQWVNELCRGTAVRKIEAALATAGELLTRQLVAAVSVSAPPRLSGDPPVEVLPAHPELVC
jgi:hypothetical protein